MSWSLPKLAGVKYLGWEAWLKRLIATSFMAPIFMFFMFIIFLFINSKIFTNVQNQQGSLEAIFGIIFPALIIIIMLKKATGFAKEGGGEFGEMLVKGGKMALGLAGGLAGGLAIGTLASGLQGGLGRLGKMGSESKRLADWETDTRKGWGGVARRFAGKNLRTITGGEDGKGGMAGSSFDARRGVMGGVLKFASTATGVNLGAQSKFLMKEEGGYVADLARRHAKGC
jgi:hypothetical protein